MPKTDETASERRMSFPCCPLSRCLPPFPVVLQSANKPVDRGFNGHRLACAGLPVLDFHLARGHRTGADNNLLGHTDQIRSCELGSGAIIAIVEEDILTGVGKVRIKLFA